MHLGEQFRIGKSIVSQCDEFGRLTVVGIYFRSAYLRCQPWRVAVALDAAVFRLRHRGDGPPSSSSLVQPHLGTPFHRLNRSQTSFRPAELSAVHAITSVF